MGEWRIRGMQIGAGMIVGYVMSTGDPVRVCSSIVAAAILLWWDVRDQVRG
jgi:hypothetical protein